MELGQLLQLLDDWLATGHEQIGTSLAELAELGPAKPARSSQVWPDLVRLLFLLAG